MKKFLYCLGVSKGGTTWLHSALVRNPGIFRVPRKEIHYLLRQYGGVDRLTDQSRLAAFATHVRRVNFVPFDSELGRSELTDPEAYGSPWDAEMAENWKPGGISAKRYRGFMGSVEWYKKYLRGPIDDAWYERLFEGVPEDKWALDFSTTNFLVRADGFARMARMAEDSRALILLRDPIDRLWSHMKFHAELTRDIHRFRVWSTSALRDFARHHTLVESSFYGAAIENMMAEFGPEKSMVLNFEEIASRPVGLFDDVQAFLGLDPVQLPKRGEEEREERVINPSVKMDMPRGLFAHLAGDFERDLERVAKCGVSFVEPWIEHAQACQREKPAPEFWGAVPLAKRAMNYVTEDRQRRQLLQTQR